MRNIIAHWQVFWLHVYYLWICMERSWLQFYFAPLFYETYCKCVHLQYAVKSIHLFIYSCHLTWTMLRLKKLSQITWTCSVAAAPASTWRAGS